MVLFAFGQFLLTVNDNQDNRAEEKDAKPEGKRSI
jgi:hypothetical protein